MGQTEAAPYFPAFWGGWFAGDDGGGSCDDGYSGDDSSYTDSSSYSSSSYSSSDSYDSISYVPPC